MHKQAYKVSNRKRDKYTHNTVLEQSFAFKVLMGLSNFFCGGGGGGKRLNFS